MFLGGIYFMRKEINKSILERIYLRGIFFEFYGDFGIL